MDNINTTALGRRQQGIENALSALHTDSSFNNREKLSVLTSIHRDIAKRINALGGDVFIEDEPENEHVAVAD
jgi:hypothetical protein